MKRNTNKQKIMERITRRRTEEKKIKEETITINMEQLEELWKDNEYAKEWKASKYNELLEENKRLKEQLEYWDKEYIKRDGKVEGYRRTKELRGQEKQMRKVKRGVKCNKCNEYGYHACKKIEKKCYTCGRIGHKQKECYKNRICKKCNREGHTEKVCRDKKLQKKED